MDYHGDACIIWFSDVKASLSHSRLNFSAGQDKNIKKSILKQPLVATDNQYFLIVGMGATGLSIAHYLTKKGCLFHFFDTRSVVASSHSVSQMFPQARQFLSIIEDEVLLNAQEIYISPGVSRDDAVVLRALAAGKSVVGDIELFLRENNQAVIGITGSNGKSTLTTMVGLAAKEAGIKVAVGGNIGIHALSLLDTDAELFVLELSSFQLESCYSQCLTVACHLNVSEDHMDRYDSFDDYVVAKQAIFAQAKHLVFNAGDSNTWPSDIEAGARLSFGLKAATTGVQGEVVPAYYFDASDALLKKSGQRLIEKRAIRSKGMHNVENALALFAIADAVGISHPACIDVLKSFPGLPHRCQVIADVDGLTFINDSKATNVGATKAAITGLKHEFEGLLLIVGGEGKGADFSELGPLIDDCVRVLLLIGKDGGTIAQYVSDAITTIFASDMADAVTQSEKHGKAGEAVLLSPACASFDMYESFEARGNVFVQCVSALDKKSSHRCKSQGVTL